MPFQEIKISAPVVGQVTQKSLSNTLNDFSLLIPKPIYLYSKATIENGLLFITGIAKFQKNIFCMTYPQIYFKQMLKPTQRFLNS
jgi:hypothetical protein